MPLYEAQIVERYLSYVDFRAVARFLCLGGGAVPDPEKFSELRSRKENCFGLLGGLGVCSNGKFFKKRVRHWLMHFPRFQLLKTR